MRKRENGIGKRLVWVSILFRFLVQEFVENE